MEDSMDASIGRLSKTTKRTLGTLILVGCLAPLAPFAIGHPEPGETTFRSPCGSLVSVVLCEEWTLVGSPRSIDGTLTASELVDVVVAPAQWPLAGDLILSTGTLCVQPAGDCQAYTRAASSGDGRNLAAPMARNAMVAWEATLDLGQDTQSVGIATNGLQAFIVGSTENQAGRKAFVAAYDVAGDVDSSAGNGQAILQWIKELPGAPGGSAAGIKVVASPRGDVIYVLLGLSESFSSDVLVVALRSTSGTEVWRNHFDGPAVQHDSDRAIDLAVSPDGSKVLAVAETLVPVGFGLEPGTLEPKHMILTLDAQTGNLLWSKSQPRSDSGGTCSCDGDPKIVVSTDRVFFASHRGRLLAAAYELATGALRWETRISEFRLDGALQLTLGQDPFRPQEQVLYVASQARATYAIEGTSPRDLAVIAIDAEVGKPSWTQSLGLRPQGASLNPSEDFADGIAVSRDGKTLFVGGHMGIEAPPATITVALDAADGGHRAKWEARFHGETGAGASAAGLALGLDGQHVYLVGHDNQAGYPTAALIAYAADAAVTISA